MFLEKVVKLTPSEVAAMRLRPSWSGLVTTIQSQPRQIRALSSYHFDSTRMQAVSMPTLLIIGSDTASPQLKQGIRTLKSTLPNAKLAVLEGQQHNAMDTAPQMLAEVISKFLLEK